MTRRNSATSLPDVVLNVRRTCEHVAEDRRVKHSLLDFISRGSRTPSRPRWNGQNGRLGCLARPRPPCPLSRENP